MNLDQSFCENILLNDLSTFGIGGPARYYYEAINEEGLGFAIRRAVSQNIPYMILGRGSNCLFSDAGYDGLVIHNKIEFFNLEGQACFVGGGQSFASVGIKTAKEGFGGLEFAAGIPGTIGGAIFMNAGCMGQQTIDNLLFVDVLDEHGEKKRLSKQEIGSQYRFTIFHEKRYAILSAAFQLYEDRSARERQREMIEYRLNTQPYQERSAGCVFRNPLNKSAGWLIEKAGLKGRKIGGAVISPIHANFIINVGNATAQDVCSLIKLIQDEVLSQFGIDLQCEIRIM